MKRSDVDGFWRKLAELANNPETSLSLRAYLKSASHRDAVDVMNELDVLARLCTSRAKRDGEP